MYKRQVQDRARGDLKIESIEADGLIVTIHTEQPVPALLNYLSDPYGCIIDMQAGVTDDGNVAGTGPYRAVQVETDQGLTLMKNDNYWNGTPKLDRIEVKTIRDGEDVYKRQLPNAEHAYGEWMRVLKTGGVLLNFDANYGKEDVADTKGLPEAHAHFKVGNEMLEECERIKSQLPISRKNRPAYDVAVLCENTAGEIRIDTSLSLIHI